MNVLCGTYAGYRRHQNRSEPACDPCRTASATYQRNRYRAAPTASPCRVCERVHPGRCTPVALRTVRLTVSLPGWLHGVVCERVPWGERSRFVADLLEKELGA